MLWTDGDRIRVVWQGGSAVSAPLSLDAETAVADFTVSLPEGTVPLYAVYPAETEASCDGSSLTVEIPAVQDGTFSQAAIEAAEVSADGTVAFKCLSAVIRLETSSAEVGALTMTAYGEVPLSGRAVCGGGRGDPFALQEGCQGGRCLETFSCQLCAQGRNAAKTRWLRTCLGVGIQVGKVHVLGESKHTSGGFSHRQGALQDAAHKGRMQQVPVITLPPRKVSPSRRSPALSVDTSLPSRRRDPSPKVVSPVAGSTLSTLPKV